MGAKKAGSAVQTAVPGATPVFVVPVGGCGGHVMVVAAAAGEGWMVLTPLRGRRGLPEA
jgi:hypothetical protein